MNTKLKEPKRAVQVLKNLDRDKQRSLAATLRRLQKKFTFKILPRHK